MIFNPLNERTHRLCSNLLIQNGRNKLLEGTLNEGCFVNIWPTAIVWGRGQGVGGRAQESHLHFLMHCSVPSAPGLKKVHRALDPVWHSGQKCVFTTLRDAFFLKAYEKSTCKMVDNCFWFLCAQAGSPIVACCICSTRQDQKHSDSKDCLRRMSDPGRSSRQPGERPNKSLFTRKLTHIKQKQNKPPKCWLFMMTFWRWEGLNG